MHFGNTFMHFEGINISLIYYLVKYLHSLHRSDHFCTFYSFLPQFFLFICFSFLKSCIEAPQYFYLLFLYL